MNHPSFVALDRLHLGLGLEADRLHAQTCQQCGAYLGRLALPVAVPTELKERLSGRPPRRWMWLGGLVAVAGALISLVTVPPEPEVRTKGAPVSSLFVKRNETITRWDSTAPVLPGDGLQLEVQPDGFTWLTVLDGIQVLWEGAVTSPRHSLPTSWRVEPGTAAIELRLVFSQTRLPATEALDAWVKGERSAQRWATTLKLSVVSSK